MKGENDHKKKKKSFFLDCSSISYCAPLFYCFWLGYLCKSVPTDYWHMLCMRQPVKCVQKTSAGAGFDNLLVSGILIHEYIKSVRHNLLEQAC